MVSGDPHYLGTFKRRVLADLVVHEADKIKKFPAPDQKVHAHHQVQVAYQFRRIMAFFLMAEKCFQLFSGLVCNPDDSLSCSSQKGFPVSSAGCQPGAELGPRYFTERSSSS